MKRISVIVPYFAYARQDRLGEGRQPISAKLLANLISTETLIALCHVNYHIHWLQGLGCRYLWGPIILPSTIHLLFTISHFFSRQMGKKRQKWITKGEVEHKMHQIIFSHKLNWRKTSTISAKKTIKVRCVLLFLE